LPVAVLGSSVNVKAFGTLNPASQEDAAILLRDPVPAVGPGR
jgi:hypothetical protein